MEITNNKYVFQADSTIVNEVYHTQDNYLIEYSPQKAKENYCAIYFSSNDIYYPNSELIFKKRIVEKNAFEWYNLKVTYAQKHIFIRDIIKQWYLKGINHNLSTPSKLLEFLKAETQGYRIITLGSSSGGYAAVLYGSLLNAEKVLSFNGQFELNSLLGSSSEEVDPIIFRNQNNALSKYYDIKPFIIPNLDIYYFHSTKSRWDKQQYEHIKDVKNIQTIPFNTSHHGIPFLKCNLPRVVHLEKEQLAKLTGKLNNPVLFSIKMVGLQQTISGFVNQAILAYQKRR